MSESGRQIGEKLFVLLTVDQKKELAQFVLEGKTGGVDSADIPCCPVFHGKYFVSKRTGQPLTDIREGEIYFCLEQRFEIFSLLIMNPKRVFTYEMFMDLVWHEDYTYYSRKAVNNHVSNLRKKLKVAPDLPDYIKSVYGIGYKFEI
ncbi:winged helix-turn-helix domain-containing protein [Ruminococcus gauvreauii]|uniref:winged helix-turn-helix domain-containing protein n=1 Tax=Ruminococcus gauvreauii TaxID=438033 RepID=UPI00067807AA